MLRANGSLNLLAVGVAAGLLAGCASHPKPGPALTSSAPAPAPAPVAEARPSPPAPAPSGPVPGSEQDFVVNVGDRVYFDLNGYVVRADAQPVLAAQASWLARYPAIQVRIEGNCDERGTREYNLALGARRANSIKEFLVGHGVPASRIATVSYGKERPLDSGTGETAWAKNRNGHTAIIGGGR